MLIVKAFGVTDWLFLFIIKKINHNEMLLKRAQNNFLLVFSSIPRKLQ